MIAHPLVSASQQCDINIMAKGLFIKVEDVFVSHNIICDVISEIDAKSHNEKLTSSQSS